MDTRLGLTNVGVTLVLLLVRGVAFVGRFLIEGQRGAQISASHIGKLHPKTREALVTTQGVGPLESVINPPREDSSNECSRIAIVSDTRMVVTTREVEIRMNESSPEDLNPSSDTVLSRIGVANTMTLTVRQHQEWT